MGGAFITLTVWGLATGIIWRGNGRRWHLGTPDLITVSLFVLVGITMVVLALGGPPPATAVEATQ